MAQWLRVCLPMQGTWVQSLVWKDFIHYEAAKPIATTTEACALESRSCNYRAHTATAEACAPTACAPQQEKPPQWEACTLQLERSSHLLQLEKALMGSEGPGKPVNESIFFFFNEKENIYIINCPNWCLGDGELCYST